MSERPNILWICSDQQRADTIGALGNDCIHTPHVDRLVAEGVSFTEAYCQSPVCTPSRASFLTGRYPRTTRCRQNGQTIPADERLLPRILADHGYRCGLAGKLHLGWCCDGKVEERIDDGYEVFHWSHHPQPDWKENAYTQWLDAQEVRWEDLYGAPEQGYVKAGVPAKYHQTTWCAEMAIDFIRRRHDRPWLFSVNMFDPHHPFDPPAEYLKRYNPDDMPVPKINPGEWSQKPLYQRLDHVRSHNEPGGMAVNQMTPHDCQRVTAAYYAMIELIDAQVGRMVEALEETGQLENTIVIYMSDHGEMLGDHGLYLKGPHFYDEAIRVPLVMRWPRAFAQNVQFDGLIELVDIAPTLLEAAGLPNEPQIQGRSLLPICSGQVPETPHRRSVYCEYYNAWTHHHAYGTMLRTPEAKIVVYHGLEAGDDASDVRGELYDLTADPDEFDNLWNRADAKDLKLEMMQRAFDASVLIMDPQPPRRGAF